MLLHNPTFWLGLLGLLLIFVSGTVLCYRLRHQSLFFTVPIWAVCFHCLKMLVHPVHIVAHLTPDLAIFMLCVGAVFAGRAWFWAWINVKPEEQKEKATAQRILKWSSIAVGLLFMYGLYKIRHLLGR